MGHGKHMCLVFETMGKNILHLIKKYHYHGIPLKMVKLITKQILSGLHYLHTECKIVHTDFKPENFLLAPTEGQYQLKAVQAERIKLVDERLAEETKRKQEEEKAREEAERLALETRGETKKLSKNQKKRMKAKAKKQLEQEQKQKEQST